MAKKQFAVLGLGRFGQKVAKELCMRGQEVVVMDKDESKVNVIKDMVTHAYIGDMTDESAMREANVQNCEVVVIGQSSNIESNLLAAQLCKELAVKQLVVKAQSTLHGKILKKLGVDMIVFPEQDTAVKLADKLTLRGIMDYMEISSEFDVIEMKAPPDFVNKKLKDLNLRKKYNVNVLAIRRGSESIMSPDGETTILAEDILIMLGNIQSMGKFSG
ncbi:MAG: ktrC [Candidatus Saganbacteria bacterium]|uniref:KtrC n=1 Tax=Candidatus Saganbacteria bacterium TaxID=2575572 RepID=A0A833L2B1_UNCSA|nr:MAG: ktrC [Candidatus Saganbacteria bacterium]